MAIDTTLDQVEALYIGYFGRAGEPDGVNYWVGQINGGYAVADMAASFSVQPEAKAEYPFLNHPELVTDPVGFITAIYQNLFERAPDQDGLDYWTEQLLGRGGDAQAIGQFIQDVISGAQADDITTLDNKVDAATYYTQQLADAGVGGTTDGVLDANLVASADAAVADVSSDPATVEASHTATDDFIAGGGAAGAGQTYTLTTALGEIVDGTPGNDTFNVITGTGATLNSFDHIDGKGGINTLNLITDAVSGGLPTASQMAHVQIINAELGAAVADVDSSGLADVTHVNLAGDFTALADVTLGADQALSLGASSAAPAAVTVHVDAAETTTTITLDNASDTTDITLDGAANTTLNINGSVDGDFSLAGADTTETINLAVTSDSIVTLNPAATDVVTTVDASASTGDLTIDASPLAGVETLLGGSGDDTLTGGAASQLINGGAGADTIVAGGVAGEVIIGGAGADTIDLTANALAQTVEFHAGDTGITAATADTVDNFTAADDLLNFNLEAGSATNFVDGGLSSSFIDALTNANTQFGADAAVQYFATNDGTDTYVFVDSDHNGTADMAVTLAGVVALTDANFVAGATV
jgi:hypothetical protein